MCDKRPFVLCLGTLLMIGCVNHPVENVLGDGTISLNGEAPEDKTLTITGVYPEPGAIIIVEAAMAKDPDAVTSTFKPLGQATTTSTPSTTSSGATYYEWALATKIPHDAWFNGVTRGSRATLRARTTLNGQDVVLGSPAFPITNELCALSKVNPNAFGSWITLLNDTCLSPASGNNLFFVFKTDNWNDHCGLEAESCCGVDPKCASGLECNPSNWCIKPGVTVPPAGTGPSGGVPDTKKDCTAGEVKEVASVTPAGCQGSFIIKGYQKCSSAGKWETATARNCDATASGTALPGDCFCNSAGGPVCGAAWGQSCSQNSACAPDMCCGNSPAGNPGMGMCTGGTVGLNRCWKADEVKKDNYCSVILPGTGGSTGTGGASSTGGASGTGGKS